MHRTNKEKKGSVGPEKEVEEDKLERFFSSIYEFHNPVTSAPAFVPAALPPRYSISFIPAVNAPVTPAVIAPVIPAVIRSCSDRLFSYFIR